MFFNKYFPKYYLHYLFSFFIITLKDKKHNKDKIKIIIILVMVEGIFTKNIGAVPKNKPKVVKPNPSPGLRFNTDTIKARVIDIVILNSITPIIDTSIILSPNNKNGNEQIILLRWMIWLYTNALRADPVTALRPMRTLKTILK